ncbi:alpha/beta hydrolase [Burkholderia ubonensis]|uniref:alpha/beta hydrolase n=1 Tax=Burkholderia ubonensis TaxID=101571 RepID=UPI00075F755D|nr:alpha/beta hydrolase [Burkholderia ubonensis]KWO64988.1 thioesterase [Burkholderia ubonensis]
MNQENRVAPLDPQLAKIVAAVRMRRAPPPFSGTPMEARDRMYRQIMAAREHTPLIQVGAIEDAVACRKDSHVPVRIYRPRASGRVPTVVFFHGGGFVLGSIELMDDIARKLCRDVEAVIVSVEYRLAPEHPYPAAHDDALTATLWAIDNAVELGGDRACIAVAGESAGGNLAASVALTLRDRAEVLAGQLLIVPGVDMARDIVALKTLQRDFPMLAPSDLEDIVRLYMGERMDEVVRSPPSPLRANSHAGLPPALIAVAGHDALCAEGRAYARCLVESGVQVRMLKFDDMFHPFFAFFEASASARRANDEICREFSRLLRTPTCRLLRDD